jgi:hypothetical protein
MKIDNELERILEDFSEELFFRFSVDATEAGVHRYDYKLSNLRKSDFSEWGNLLEDFRRKIQKFKNSKSRERNTDVFLFEKRILEESKCISEEAEYFSNPSFYMSNTFKGLIFPAFGSYSPLGIRGKSFTERLKDVPNVRRSIEENIKVSNNLEKKVAREQLGIMNLLISEFSGYLLTKSDIEKKDDLRQSKNTVLEELNALGLVIDNLSSDISIEPSFVKAIKCRYPEIINSLSDTLPGLKDSIAKVTDLIIKKAREIKIYAPFAETLKNIMDEKTSFSQEEFDSVLQSIKDAAKQDFGETSLRVELKKPALSEENTQKLSDPYYPLSIVNPGVFDRNQTTSFTLLAQLTTPFLALKLAENIYPGKSFFVEIKKNREKHYRKIFENRILAEGWTVYSLKQVKDNLKNKFGNGFELTFLYNDYIGLVKALIEARLLKQEINPADLERIISEDPIIIDKNLFTRELITDEGRSLLGFVGYNSILDLKRQFSRKYREREFHMNLLSNSSLPFRILRQVL